VTISVYNILGQKVRTLVNEVKSSGAHAAIWNGDDDSGTPVSSGIYLYRIETDDRIIAKKMLLLR
jgi:flagellar hook assembly protein FlgD